MTEIITTSLEELQKDHKQFRNQNIRLKEFPLFHTGGRVYDDYHLIIGPNGGATVWYAKGKTLAVGMRPFKEGNEEDGIWHTTRSGYTNINYSIFPGRKDIPKVLKNVELDASKMVEQYKKTYLNAKKRLDAIRELNEKYPEYSL